MVNSTNQKPQEQYKQKQAASISQDKGPSLLQSKRELGEQYQQKQTGPSLAESEQEQEYVYQLELARAQQRMLQDEETARMEEESQKPVPMGLLLFLFMLLVTVILDVIDIFTGGTLGWLIGIFGDLLLLVFVGISKSGRKQFKRIIAGLLGDSIPIIAFLPIRTIFLVWAFLSSRSTKLQAVGQITTKAAIVRPPQK
ncbi:MAG: hypothetical protein A2736_00355 [Candidatus Yanofskybacteria bacterium RIFCSPHIGHO2_01_FULL_41_27]|uniref:Uncharacterized protein n=2 Tax=Parcubacteria group TaxID=1794811 RepID=A0A0G0XIY3_9BACT|nr:MAG: hypothetical protein UU83_C0019G0021 [Candidatus Jorgensenbacteria bacterium GW2011_GWF2_41_8]OGN00385.1 MAG: hypothetical protein A2736_00355 [Candidatus Yanofskybacteria bacterium RIFCSPHIGHO2_01_FULL_41_27]